MADDETAGVPSRKHWASFWSLMGLQAQSALALQFALVPLGAWLAHGAGWGKSLPHLLGTLVLLPFIAFAPVAGWASDSFSKTRVIRLTAWMQLVVLVVVLACFQEEVLPLAVACFFFLALQWTILSPARNGIIKELLGSTPLGFASGIMQMVTILAILAGQILIGLWFPARLEVDGSGWRADLFPMLLIALGAVVTLALAYSIQVMPTMGRKVPFRARLLVSHFRQLGQLFGSVPLRLSALGIAYFWAFGTIMHFITLQIATELYPEGNAGFARAMSFMMLAAGGGIALGGILGAMINRRHIELGLNPVGGVLMMISSLLLFLAVPESALFYAALCGAGFGAAFFVVPISAFLQDECDPTQRGNILAGSALLNCVAVGGAVVLQLVLLRAGLSTAVQFLLVGLTAAAATWYVMRLLPRAFVKLLTLSALRAFYRIEAINAQRMPATGGVLLVPNHVSYLDALILTAASPRPVRFVMIRSYFKMPLVGKFAELFDTIPISATRAKDAIRVAAEALEEGSVVCIFPEGMLSRSGFLGEIKRGFGLIARRAGCPVQAVYLDGLWKSIFSAERGKFFWKLPRTIPFGVRVAFDEARSPGANQAELVKRRLNALAGGVLARRRESSPDLTGFLARRSEHARAAVWWHGGKLGHCSWREVRRVIAGEEAPGEVAGGHAGAEVWLAEWLLLAALPDEEVQGLILNAQQLTDVHDLGGRKHTVVIDQEAPVAVRRVWGMLLPALVHRQAVPIGEGDEATTVLRLMEAGVMLRDLVGTERVRGMISAAAGGGGHLLCYRFGGGPQTVAEGAMEVYACHEDGARILSLSIPPAPIIRKADLAEAGWLEGAYGRLLNGFVVQNDDALLEIGGAMVADLIRKPGWVVDPRGFLWPPAAAAEGEAAPGRPTSGA